jgi:hypothetical protein
MQDTEFPQLDFSLAGWVSKDDVPITLKLAEDRPWKVMFGSAGLALSMNESPNRSALPSSLPGQSRPVDVPSVESRPAPPLAADIDDAVGKW